MTRERPRTPAENAELALLLEVAGTPKPGNVDRHRDLDDLRFEQFLAGSVGSAGGLRAAAEGAPLGEAFERAVRGMSRQSGGNTQFGCLLLLTPLVRAAAEGELGREAVRERCRATTVDDAVAFYRAFEHVDVAVGDPPAGAGDGSQSPSSATADDGSQSPSCTTADDGSQSPSCTTADDGSQSPSSATPDELDVRRGSSAKPALRERETTLWDVMELSAAADGIPDTNALEWVEGFPRTFDAANLLLADDGPVLDRAARCFLRQLAAEPDSLVATVHDESTAREARERAEATLEAVERTGSLAPAEDLADAFVAEGINPGTTADRVAAALFVALERGLAV